MKNETFEKLCCPFDKEDLELTAITKNVEQEVVEGFLSCDNCKRIYPIVKGIPIMNPDEYRELQFEKPLLEKLKPYLKNREVKNFKLVE